jgi:hypothetical protein
MCANRFLTQMGEMMWTNLILTQRRRGAEKRRGYGAEKLHFFNLCGTLRLCVSALIFSPTAFGQSITATKAYVDKRVGAVATNTLPARFVPQKGFDLKHYNVSERTTIGAPLTITNSLSVRGESTFAGKVTLSGVTVIRNGSAHFSSMDADLLAVNNDFDVMGLLRMVDPLGGIVRFDGYADDGSALTTPLRDLVVTPETVTNIARDVVNTIWDSSLGVAWEARMHNGHLYYIAVTNKQETK